MAELTGVLSVLAAYGAWLLVALRQRRHAAAVSGSALDSRARGRALALSLALFIASFACALQARGPALGSLFAVLALSLAAVGVTLTLAFRPGWARPLAKLLSFGVHG